MRFNTVFFDSGGTLYSDNSYGSAPTSNVVEAGRTLRLHGALAGMGYQTSVPEIDMAMAATRDTARREHGRFYSHAHWVSAALAHLKLQVWPEEAAILADAFLGPRYRDWLFPGTFDAIAELHKARVYLGVIANTHWPGYAMHRHFEGTGLAQFWSVQLYSCEVGIDKPDPEIFLLAEQRSGRSNASSSILYVGNSEKNDIDGAHGVGWQAAFRREPGRPGYEAAEFNFEDSSELVRIILG